MNWLRFAMTCLVALMLLWHIYGDDRGIDNSSPSIYLYGCMLPIYLGSLAAVSVLLYDGRTALNMVLTLCFDIFFMISIYYCLIALLIKPLRKVIRAKSCALLWMVPNYLYFLQRSNSGLAQEEPLFIFSLPGKLANAVFLVWFLGFAGILIWKSLSHLHFRRWLLSGSTPIRDEETGKLWVDEKERLHLQERSIPLLRAPNAATPLSIGLWDNTTCVVLPEKAYTKEELTLILRHELTHVQRRDSMTKLFLTICTAMCWFNPLMWFAVHRSADDLELSCDEQVLKDASSETRRLYANLILNTAGDQRGFTSCLSASLRAMTYRLKSIVSPEKKLWGGFLIALVFVILAMCCGHVSLAYTEEPGSSVIYQDLPPSEFHIQSISLPNGKHHSTLQCREEEKLADYLSGLTLRRITGEYDFPEFENTLYMLLTHGTNWVSVTIKDQILILRPYQTSRAWTGTFLIEEAVDWEYLQSLMEYGPSLLLHFDTEAEAKTTSATLYSLDRIRSGQTEPVHRGSQTTNITSMLDASTDRIHLDFSHDLSEEYTVTIENWDRTEHQTLSQSQLEIADTLPLPQRSGHYTVNAKLQGDNGVFYDAEFRFDIHDAAYEEAHP